MTLGVPRIEIPVLSPAVVRLLAIPTDDSDYLESVLAAVAGDPGLVTSAFRFANAAAVKGTAGPLYVRDAVMRVGPSRFVARIVGSNLATAFQPQTPELKLLWRHALLTAVANRRLATELGASAASVEAAYVCGLLHNVGCMAIARAQPAVYARLLAHHPIDSAELRDWESRTFGQSHVEVGLRVASEWHLPADLAATIRHHHEDVPPSAPYRWSIMATQASMEVASASLADLVSREARPAETLERMARSLRAIGSSRGDVKTIEVFVDEVGTQCVEESRSLGIAC